MKAGASASKASATTPLNALIIEDSSDDALLLVTELKSLGFELNWRRVETDAECEEALRERWDVIFSDYSLPQFSVARALELLHEAQPETPFIIVSGTIGEERLVESLKAGATDYVLKDRLNRLGPVIQRALRETREAREKTRAQQELHAAHEKLRVLLSRSPAVLYSIRIVRGEFTGFWISENLERLSGYEPGDVSPEWWRSGIHPEDRERVLADIAELKKTGHRLMEYRFRRKDGTYFWVSDEQRLIRDAEGKPGEIVGVWTDITVSKSLEAQLRQAQKMESIGLLAGGVAHDFNNILTVIQGHAAILLSNPQVKGELAESAEQIALASERAANLTRQLLTFSRKQVMRPRVLNLNETVGNLLKMLKRILGEDISLRVNCASHVSLIMADTGMLEQVLMNLAVNARDAMPGGGELIISTSDEEVDPDYVHLNPQAVPGNYVCLSVADTGTGIAPEHLPRIFDPFFTTKAVGKGTGLGLATVYGIVQQHGGWITVYSEAGRGTVFRIYLPVAKNATETSEKRMPERRIRGGNETILLVEDEGPVRSLARNVLERHGYKVLEAFSGVDAMHLWKQHNRSIDLVLTDMVMPGGITGLDLARKLSADKPDLRVIYTSGYSVDIIGKDFELRDGLNFLQKPFAPRKLAQTVRDALDH